MTDEIYITEGLSSTLLETARRYDPCDVSIPLFTVPAEELGEYTPELSNTSPVFAGFYPPYASQSVKEVFGLELGVPNGGVDGRFVSHPNGDRTVKLTDDLHSIIFVGVPPWDEIKNAFTAYTRSGKELDVVFVSVDDEEYSVESL